MCVHAKLFYGQSLSFVVVCSLKVSVVRAAGLSYDTNEPVLKDAFRQFGDIIEGMSGERFELHVFSSHGGLNFC